MSSHRELGRPEHNNIEKLENAVHDSQTCEKNCEAQLQKLREAIPAHSVQHNREPCERDDQRRAVQRGLHLALQLQDKGPTPRSSTQGVTITKVGSTTVYTLLLAYTGENEVFCARDNEDNRLVVFIDDGSEVTLVAQSLVSNEWDTHEGEGINITGIGSSKKGTKASQMVTVPLRLRSAMSESWVTGYVVPDNVLPEGIDILVGKPTIKHMGIRPDSRNMRMEFAEVETTAGIPLVVNTMPLEKQTEIITAPSLKVLDICGGGSFSYQTLRDMGYDIERYHAIEIDPKARAIARCHSEGNVEHLDPNNLLHLRT